MRIALWHRCSTSDFPGKRSLVLICSGCNLRCCNCHKRSFLVDRAVRESIPVDSILCHLEHFKSELDAVVIKGGEPTLQKNLDSFLTELRNLGYCTKLHTNGSKPDVLESLISKSLVDVISMDIKAPPAKLSHITGIALPWKHLEESAELLMKSKVDYEFCTTVLPEFSFEDILAIGQRIAGARRYVLQQFRKPFGFSAKQYPLKGNIAHGPNFFLELKEHMRDWFQEISVRGINLDGFQASRSFHEPAFSALEDIPQTRYLA